MNKDYDRDTLLSRFATFEPLIDYRIDAIISRSGQEFQKNALTPTRILRWLTVAFPDFTAQLFLDLRNNVLSVSVGIANGYGRAITVDDIMGTIIDVIPINKRYRFSVLLADAYDLDKDMCYDLLATLADKKHKKSKSKKSAKPVPVAEPEELEEEPKAEEPTFGESDPDLSEED